MRALTHQHDHVGIFQAHRQLPQAFDGIGIDLGGISIQARCAMELAHSVLVIIKDHDIHPAIVQVLMAANVMVTLPPADPELARWLMPVLHQNGH